MHQVSGKESGERIRYRVAQNLSVGEQVVVGEVALRIVDYLKTRSGYKDQSIKAHNFNQHPKQMQGN